jgi:beta-glucuronidase
VWVNGVPVGSHAGGYLPFAFDITRAVNSGTNRLTLSVDSRLTMDTVPQGIDPGTAPYDGAAYDRRHTYPPTRFDFFPYGGLTRSVQIVVVPARHIQRISLRAAPSGNVTMSAACTGGGRTAGTLRILDPQGVQVAGASSVMFHDGQAECTLTVARPSLWSPRHPHLYTAHLTLLAEDGNECDSYEETFGFREIRTEGGQILFNGAPLYLVGFGRHEDFPGVGHGQFRPAYVRDFELMRWTGANSFRTSHYPYDEETLRLADRLGFLVIDEVPAVSLGFPSDRFEDLEPLLANHRRALAGLIERDMNHPSVIAWSLANEPNLWSEPEYQNAASRRYFQNLYEHARALDPHRPVIAITTPSHGIEDVSLGACDIIGINRYYGWYTDPADLEKARQMLDQEMDAMFARHGKPIIITECGADTVEGLHATVPQMFTEEYQKEFLRVYSSVADRKPYCAGIHVWNFADFLTPQHFRRMVFNRKGVFTRTREPKSAAFFLRSHWTTLDRVADDHRPQRFGDTFLIGDIKRPR